MEKKKVMWTLFLFIGILSLVGSSYAYFVVIFKDERTSDHNGNTNMKTEVLSSAVLISNVDNSVGSFIEADIYPGHKEVSSIKVNVSGEKDSKIGVKFIYEIEENGLKDNIRVSLYKSKNKIEVTKNYFNCQKETEKKDKETILYETCEERDLELKIAEKELTGNEDILEIVTDTVYVTEEGKDEEYYYYFVVEFLNKEESQNEVMNKVLKGKVKVEGAVPESSTFESSVVAYGRLGNSIANSMLYSSHLDKENLAYDETVDNNLRYIGANPNNYVRFNNELWRIIGVMNNVEDADGNKDSRVKLIRDESIGSYSWDSSSSDINKGYGINEWSQADIMKLLNPGFADETVGGSLYWNSKSGSCYCNYSNQTTSCNFTNTGLMDESKKMIEKVVWNTGSNGNAEQWDNILTSKFYELERSKNTGKTCRNGIECTDNISRTTTWLGYIGLMYPSDYGFATAGDTITSRDSCLKTKLYDWNNFGGCYQNDWLYISSSQWTMTPSDEVLRSTGVFHLLVSDDTRKGQISSRYASMVSNTSSTFPALYLKSSVHITNGNGSQKSPYELEMEV